MESAADKPGRCSRCGKLLPQDAAEGLCAACLFTAGTESITHSVGDAPTAWGGGAPDAAYESSRLIAGQSWGPYRVGRLLGRGGMGEVYEAEHTRSGRRLALKVLRSRLDSPDERARFLREGQLAASVSHPHTVYIFGSEEISGTPVISMELTPGGTLKDRVASKGPLAPTEAVSAVLDIIGGLDAAQAAGILHRDIKPSNCFVDGQGSVKVGDFGLSISTLARDVQNDVSGRGFQGTPQFASPEQLRGEPLDVRSDIYAVGATLYYLLTGQPPFEAEDLRTMVHKVTAETPKSPRVLRSEIPSGLASIVLRCLAKTPSERPASYADLARDLRPFSSTGQAPAGLGVRFLAGLADNFLLTAVVDLFLVVGPPSFGPFAGAALWVLVPLFVYFLLEGFTGATPGKRLFGLRVRGIDGGMAPWRSIAWRNLIYHLPTLAWAAPVFIVGAGRYNAFLADTVHQVWSTAAGFAAFGAYFLTARRSNGWAAVHDLASRTRVVRTSGLERRRSVGVSGIAQHPGERVPPGQHYGPFAVISDAGPVVEGRLFVGFDPALRRRVWIQTHAPGTPTITAARRDASRPGRLHWLTGRRSADENEENWDAFEAPDGEPLTAHRGRASWLTMKMWLTDLANELHAAIQEGTLPELALDRIWIRSDGRLMLLDFPAAGVSSNASLGSAGGTMAPVQLLSAVASFCLSEHSGPNSVPLRVRSMIERWTGPEAPELSEARAGLLDLSTVPDQVTRWRRGSVVAMTTVPFLFLFVAVLVSVLARPPRDKGEMLQLLDALEDGNVLVGNNIADPAYRAAVEVYLAGRHGASLRDDAFWAGRGRPDWAFGALRTLAAEVASRHPSVSDEDLSHAESVIAPQLERIRHFLEPATVGGQAVSLMGNVMGIVLAICSLIWSVILPGGPMLRAAGLAVVTRDGKQIGRLRAAARVLTTWAPTIVWAIGLYVYVEIVRKDSLLLAEWWVIALTLGPLALGALWTVTHPEQGLHDRVTRTWVVPR